MVTVKADSRKRVQIPGINPGQVFALKQEDGKIVLIPLNHTEPRTVILKLVRRGDRLIPETTGFTIHAADIAQAVREDRDTLAERGVRC